MAKKQGKGGIVNGGAVIIDDGSGLRPGSRAGKAMDVRLDSTDFNVDGLTATIPCHLLENLKTERVVVHYHGEIVYKWSEVKSFKVSASKGRVSGDLAADTLVLKANRKLSRKPAPKNVFTLDQSGSIKRIEVDLTNGSKLDIKDRAWLELFFKVRRSGS